MARVLAFDVNETLLDLSSLDRLFEESFGDAGFRAQWFGQMLQLGFVGGLTGHYVDFSTAQRAALTMLAETTGTALDPQAGDRILDGMRTLAAHADVRPALDRLRETGLTLVALTNSPLRVVQDQLAYAGLTESFEAVFSADQVRALKPRPEPYRLVAERSQVAIGDVRLVAAHAWDIAGALAAGCRAAFVERPGKVLAPVGERPDIVGGDLVEVAERIAEVDGI